MKRKARIYLGIGALSVVLIALWSYLAGGTPAQMVTVQRGSIIKSVEDNGYVQPATGYDIDAIQNARVLQVPVKVGDAVTRGQTLLVMENKDLDVQVSEIQTQLSQAETAVAGARAALESARLQLADSQSNCDRYRQLYASGAASKSDYDKAQLALDTARQAVAEQASGLDADNAQVSGLQQTLNQLQAEEKQLVVTSPVNGVILSLPVKEQQVVLPGTLLVSVAASPASGQPGRAPAATGAPAGHPSGGWVGYPGNPAAVSLLEVRADILSDDMADVRVGQTVAVTAPVLGQNTLTGTVEQIYPQAEEEQSALGVIQRRVPVIITLPEPGQLQSGYEVQVAIQTDSRQNVPVVPVESVRTDQNGRQVVMLVSHGRAYQRFVQTGISDRRNIEIITGLQVGDTIVRDGSLSLANGTRVKPA
jgi:HlyD family secretion protein